MTDLDPLWTTRAKGKQPVKLHNDISQIRGHPQNISIEVIKQAIEQNKHCPPRHIEGGVTKPAAPAALSHV